MKHKNFLKKLTAGILGFVMTLGVGAAGYAASASETRAATQKTTTMNWGGTTNQFTFNDSGDTYLEWTYAGGTSQNNPIQNDDFRMYAGVSLTVKAKSSYANSVTIKSLKITGKSSKNNNSLFYNASTGAIVTSGSELSWTTSSSTKTATFNDGLNSVSVSRVSSGNQVRVTKVEVTYYLTESKSLTSIAVSELHRSFTVGDTFVKETVTATYSDSSTADVTNSATFSSPDMSTTGEKTVNVSYTEGGVTKNTSYTINVTEPAVLQTLTVSGTPTNLNYNAGDTFNPAGLTVTGHYDDGSDRSVTPTDWVFTPATLSAGATSVYVVAKVGDISSNSYNVTGLTVSQSYIYDKVTSDLTDWTGHYLIASGSKAWDAHSTISKSGTYVNITEGATVTLNHNNYEWEFVEGSASGKYAIKSQVKDSGGNYYYIDEGSTSGNVDTSTTPADMTITYNSIQASSYYLRYNFGYFRFYSNSSQGSAISLYKLREATKYSITYNLNGPTGDPPTQEKLAEGSKFNLAAAPSWTGHTFAGWSDGTNTYAAGYEYTVGTSNLTFTAQWTTLGVKSISVNTAPNKVVYTTGNKFQPNGLVINVVFDNDTSTTASYASESSNFSFNPDLNTELATTHTSVTITYKEQSCSQAITVEDPKTVTSIVISGTTTNFKIGSSFVGPTSVTAKYNHGVDQDVTDRVQISGYNMNTAGTQTVTVSYTEDGTTVSDTYSINVITISSFTVTGSVSGNVGSAWDTSNVVVKANWASTFSQETLASSDYTLTLDPATPTKGTTSVMVDVSYKNGLVSKTDVAELDAIVTSITYDTLVWSDTNVSTSYSDWSGVSKTSDAVYAGFTAKNTKDYVDQIQIKSKEGSGIWSSSSGGNIKSASLVWGPSTTIARAVEFYGRNDKAYSTDDKTYITEQTSLENYGKRNLGTYLGMITWGSGNATSVSFTGSYKYVCAVGLGGALYLESITFGWGEADSLSSLSISGQKTSFVLGETFSLGDSYTATARYTESGSKTVTSGFTYEMGESLEELEPITIDYPVTLDDDGKYVVVTYTDPNDSNQHASAQEYQIEVDYAPATEVEITNAHGKTSNDPLVIAVGRTSETITANVKPIGCVEEGILIDDDGLTHVQVNNDDTLTGLSAGDEVVTVYSADMEAWTYLYVSVTLVPGMDISDETLAGGSGGTGELLVVPFNIPQGKTPSYVWTVEDDDPTGCVTVTPDDEDNALAVVNYNAGGTATIKVEGKIDNEVFDTKYCTVTVTKSEITTFEVDQSPNLIIYTGDYDTKVTFTPTVVAAGIATDEIKWRTTNDSVILSGGHTDASGNYVSNGSEPIVATYNPGRKSTSQSVQVVATSTFDSSKTKTKTIDIIQEEVTSFTWTGGSDIKCYEGTALDASDWSFAASFASGDSKTPVLGNGANDVHVYIVDDASITNEPTTLTPVSNGQTLSVSDNGYLVAFYKGCKCTSTYTSCVVDNLNSIIAERTIVDEGTKTTNAITSKVFDTGNLTKTINDLTLTLDNNGGYYGSDSTKGQQVGSGNAPATSMTLSTSVSGAISKVVVNTSGAKDVVASVSVTVGSTNFTCNNQTSVSISAIATPYEFTGSASGTVVISWSQTSSKALYFNQVDVTYNNTTITHPEVANTDIDVQSKVVEYARAFNTYETIDSATWSTLKANFNTMINSFSTEAEKSLAREMFKYATTDSTQLDVLQQCVKKYDKALAKLGLEDSENFMNRTRIQIDCSISSYMGFKFTGLTMEKGQLTYEATYNGTAIECGFVAYKVVNGQTADFSKYALADLKNGELSGARVYSGDSTKTQLVMGIPTTNMDATLQVAFYFIDDQNEIHWSDSITMSFNDAAKAYDLDSIEDKYARACLEYYLYTLENPVEE